MKTDKELQDLGFTSSGMVRYKDAMTEFETQLTSKAIAYATASKAPDSDLEVTHDHVRSSAAQLSATFKGRTSHPKATLMQIGEYVATAFAGLGAGYSKETWGIVVFVISLVVGVVLFVLRATWRETK